MRLHRSHHGNILVVEAGGNVDSVGAEQLGSFLQFEIEAGKRYLVLDLQGVNKLGHDGLWEMVSALKQARRGRGDLRLAQPSDRAREAIEMSGLDQIFRIFDSQADAVASY